MGKSLAGSFALAVVISLTYLGILGGAVYYAAQSMP